MNERTRLGAWQYEEGGGVRRRRLAGRGVGILKLLSYVTYIVIHKIINRSPTLKLEENEVRVLPREVADCQEHIIERITCGPTCAYSHVFWIIQDILNAGKTIDVCMYLLSYGEIVVALIKAHESGVYVRLITTPDKEDTGTMVLKIRRAGIPVRAMVGPQSELMHLKFILIDEKFVIFGSMNFTVSGFTGNTEELLRMTDKHIVSSCSNYFDSLWGDFSDQDVFLNNMARLKSISQGSKV